MNKNEIPIGQISIAEWDALEPKLELLNSTSWDEDDADALNSFQLGDGSIYIVRCVYSETSLMPAHYIISRIEDCSSPVIFLENTQAEWDARDDADTLNSLQVEFGEIKLLSDKDCRMLLQLYDWLSQQCRFIYGERSWIYDMDTNHKYWAFVNKHWDLFAVDPNSFISRDSHLVAVSSFISRDSQGRPVAGPQGTAIMFYEEAIPKVARLFQRLMLNLKNPNKRIEIDSAEIIEWIQPIKTEMQKALDEYRITLQVEDNRMFLIWGQMRKVQVLQ